MKRIGLRVVGDEVHCKKNVTVSSTTTISDYATHHTEGKPEEQSLNVDAGGGGTAVVPSQKLAPTLERHPHVDQAPPPRERLRYLQGHSWRACSMGSRIC